MAQVELLPEVQKFLEGEPKMFVDGVRTDASSGATFDVVDPSTGRAFTAVPRGGAKDVDAAVAAARRAFEDRRWTGLRPGKRAEILFKVGELIKRRTPELAQIESLDSGKPVALASGEMWFAGECFRIIPWNYPLLMAAWKVAPALAFGNTVVLKPAEQTPLTALLLAEICLEAGVPEGVVNVVTGFGEEAGAALAAHTDVDKIAFTGSTDVGKKILQASTGNLKRVTLELGGKSPNIVFGDANLRRAAKGSMMGVFTNSGQMCTAGTRILVEKAVHDEFVSSLVEAAQTMKVGPGLAEDTGMGPVVSAEQLERVTGYIDLGRSEGAEVAYGGERVEGMGDGYFVQPTIFTGVRNSMRIAQEEIFGPVAAVIEVDDVDHAIEVANDTMYGLAAAVWTTDLSTAHRVARGIRAGTVWVNTAGLYDPGTSFGGYKQSGFGRELGLHSLDTYTQTKSVWVSLK